jgi:hypothetical protein
MKKLPPGVAAERKKAQQQQYYLANRERILDRGRAHARLAAHREERRERDEKNREHKRAYAKMYRETHREDKNKSARAYEQRRKARLGKVPPDGQKCEVCCATPVVWDHDHRSGIHRGWLCRSCNLAAGYLKDDIDRLKTLTAYLRRGSEKAAVRAAWQVMRDMGLPLNVAAVFRERLEDQLERWHVDDAEADPEVAA